MYDIIDQIEYIVCILSTFDKEHHNLWSDPCFLLFCSDETNNDPENQNKFSLAD